MTDQTRTNLRAAAAGTAVAALMTAGLVGFAAAPASAYQGVATYWTPGTYSWTVPAGVTSISVKAYGAQGGNGVPELGYGSGGKGAAATAIVPVAPGQQLTFVVGGQPTGREGGIGGGGDGADAFLGDAAGGGGASSVTLGTTTLVVAGGGGGSARDGVDGAASSGNGGSLAALSSAHGWGGGAGRSTGAAGGAGGDDLGLVGCPTSRDGIAGLPGSRGQGGGGGGRIDTYINHGGGGGGGGYYGGAGGGGAAWCSASGGTAAGGGGGGGTSYLVPGASQAQVTEGTQSGNGTIVIQY